MDTRGRLTIAAVAVSVLVGLGCASFRQRPPVAEDPAPPVYVDASSEPVPSTAPPPQAAPSSPPATRTSPSRRPPVSPSRKPTQIALPPPPPPPPTSTANCPTFTGTPASSSAVRGALDTAAGRSYWGSIPTIKVPARLLYAIAWQESGWRSTVVGCDGAIGTMQVLPDTATWMNTRFGTSYDVHTLAGNTSLGAQYLAWLIRYLGDVFFGGIYDLGEQALLDSVVSAYNVGFGAVDPTKGRDGIPNWWYVDSVKRYLESCPCLS
jgi:Transglycosylase SLT domain